MSSNKINILKSSYKFFIQVNHPQKGLMRVVWNKDGDYLLNDFPEAKIKLNELQKNTKLSYRIIKCFYEETIFTEWTSLLKIVKFDKNEEEEISLAGNEKTPLQ
jgi:hypothetical protein